MTFKNKIIATFLGTALVAAFGVIANSAAVKKISNARIGGSQYSIAPPSEQLG